MEGIPGVPAPIPHSKVAGSHQIRIAGSGASLANEPVNLPLVKLAPIGEVASMSASQRLEYIRSVGQQTMARAAAKAIDILA